MRNNWPTFEEGMKYSLDYNTERLRDDKWDIIRNRYYEIKTRDFTEQKIPKIIHQIWLGKAMPQLEQDLTKQVKNKIGSDWNYKLWTEQNLAETQSLNLELYNSTPNFGQRSDLLRYAILNDFGGVYMDTDFLLLRDLNEITDLEFVCGVAYDNRPSLFNGLICSTPNNEITRSLLTLDRQISYSDGMKLMDATGPFFLTRKVFAQIQENRDVLVLPNSFFYPLPNFDRSRQHGNDYNKYITPTTFCCHMWSSAWM